MKKMLTYSNINIAATLAATLTSLLHHPEHDWHKMTIRLGPESLCLLSLDKDCRKLTTAVK